MVRSVDRRPFVEVTAPVQAEQRATLRTEAAGRVLEAPLRAGAEVQAGDLLLRLDVERSAIGVRQAEARVSQAEAGLRQVTRAREDAEALAAEGASTPNSVAQARDREAEGRARFAEAEAALRAARAGVGEAVLRAPFDGVLADFRLQVGELAPAGAEVAVLVNGTALEAELLLDPSEGRDAALDSPVELHLAAHPERTFTARVTQVGRVLDPRSRRLPVRVAVDDPEGRIRPGEVATFRVGVGELRPCVLVPERAVIRRMGQAQVFVVGEDSTAGAREVTVGEVRGGEAEILDGLDGGERVIVGGVERVVAGQRVRIVARDAEPGAR